MLIPPAVLVARASNHSVHPHDATVIGIMSNAPLGDLQPALPLDSRPYHSSASDLPTPLRHQAVSAPRRCSVPLKIGIASAISGLGSCALLVHSITRTLDNRPSAPPPDYCKGAIECGSPDASNLAIEYVGAAVLGLAGLFGAGAAWMCRGSDRP